MSQANLRSRLFSPGVFYRWCGQCRVRILLDKENHAVPDRSPTKNTLASSDGGGYFGTPGSTPELPRSQERGSGLPASAGGPFSAADMFSRRFIIGNKTEGRHERGGSDS